MKYFFLLACLCSSIYSIAQEDPNEITKPIVEEGKKLYRSEMASWYGTDVFLAKFKDRANVGGYFSYTEGDISRCIFFSKSSEPVVIGTISFDSTYNTETAQTDLKERAFNEQEKTLYILRQLAKDEIQKDTLFKTFKNTNLNMIPLISGNQKKVYVLTGTDQNGVVIFGNDYLLTFDENNKHLKSIQLHKSMIPIEYKNQPDGQVVIGAMHTHFPELGEFITATDICTLMLYSKFAKWQQHMVVSKTYISIWNCQTNSLIVITKEAMEKINADQEKRSKKN